MLDTSEQSNRYAPKRCFAKRHVSSEAWRREPSIRAPFRISNFCSCEDDGEGWRLNMSCWANENEPNSWSLKTKDSEFAADSVKGRFTARKRIMRNRPRFRSACPSSFLRTWTKKTKMILLSCVLEARKNTYWSKKTTKKRLNDTFVKVARPIAKIIRTNKTRDKHSEKRHFTDPAAARHA